MHLWDMKIIDYMKTGQCQRIIDEMPEFTEQAIAETDGGAFTWLLSTLEVPDYPAILHGYGTIIGTGNAIVEWPVYRQKEGIGLSNGEIVESFVVPVHPHTVLAPEQNAGWQKLRDAYDDAAKIIAESGADLIIIYSTTWPSIIGHQIQSDPNPEWVMVDHDFHELGSIHYSFNIDEEFAKLWNNENKQRGLQSRCVNYRGFPIDVGSVVALTLLNPDNKIPAVIVSSNVYADRSETTVLAKSCLDIVRNTGRKAVAVAAMSLSNRMFTEHIDPKDDKIHSLKDDEWNRKILEFLGQGRLEDVGQLSRTIQQQIRVQKVVNFKPMWWLSAMNENRNNLTGKVLAYEAVHGAGCAVVNLNPAASGLVTKSMTKITSRYSRANVAY